MLKAFDFFGKPVSFSFKKKEEYRTHCGGFCSLLIRIVMGYYAFILLKRAFGREEDRLKVYETVDADDSFKNNLKDMQMVPIMALQNTALKGSPYVDLAKAKKVLDLKFFVNTFTLKADNTYDATF
jgi:hypothetical protein